MSGPAISVIVPIYNVESFVIGCLSGIQNQTFPDFEVICVNDGSTDKSAELAMAFIQNDKRFRLINQENKGLSGARNTGLDAAKGQYIFFLDSDDYIHPDTLKILYDVAQKQKASLVGAGLVKTKSVYNAEFPEIKESQLTVENIENPIDAYLSARRDVATGVCTRLYHRDLIGQLRFIEGIYFEDVPFTTKIMFSAKKMALVPADLYYYYQSPVSIIRSGFNDKKVLSYITVIRSVYRDVIENYPDYLEKVRRSVLNGRVRMVLNGAAKKQKDKRLCLQMFDLLQSELTKLYQEEIISYSGLKLKHKVTLWLLLHNHPKAACLFLRML